MVIVYCFHDSVLSSTPPYFVNPFLYVVLYFLMPVTDLGHGSAQLSPKFIVHIGPFEAIHDVESNGYSQVIVIHSLSDSHISYSLRLPLQHIIRSHVNG